MMRLSHIIHVRCGSDQGMNHPRHIIHAKLHLYPEMPLTAFARLVHLPVALAFFVPGETRCVDQASVHRLIA